MEYSLHNTQALELVIYFMLNMDKLNQLNEMLKMHIHFLPVKTW